MIEFFERVDLVSNDFEQVTVKLDPARTVSEHKSSWLLKADECESIQLPQNQVALVDGQTVETITIPRWLAEDRGLIPSEETDDNQTSNNEQMTRHDWLELGAMVGFLASGMDPSEVPWNSRKMADRMTGE